MLGFALGLTTCAKDGEAWCSDRAYVRARARANVEKDTPCLSIGSPTCKAFGSWQRLNAVSRDTEEVRREYLKVMVHLGFVCRLCQLQIGSGRYLLHEHPARAPSCKESCARRILSPPGIYHGVCDQCQYGSGSEHRRPIERPTMFMINAKHLADELIRMCNGRGGKCVTGNGTSDVRVATRRVPRSTLKLSAVRF